MLRLCTDQRTLRRKNLHKNTTLDASSVNPASLSSGMSKESEADARLSCFSHIHVLTLENVQMILEELFKDIFGGCACGADGVVGEV